MIRHAGTTLALVESGFPHAVSPDLGRARIHDFDGSLASPMTAHPKVDPVTGELLFFGYDVFGPPFLRYHVADRDGGLVRTEAIEIPRATMIHDFGVTASRVVFLDLPVLFDLDLATMGRSLPYRWVPEAGARVGVMPRHGGNEDIRWIGIDPVYVFHVLNAYDEGDTVVMDVIRYDRAFDTDPGRPVSSALPIAGPLDHRPGRRDASPSDASTTSRSSSRGSTTPWPGCPTGTATAYAWATAPTSPASWDSSSTTWSATSRPGSTPARTGSRGSRSSCGPPTGGTRARDGSSPSSTTPAPTPATW